VRRVRIPRPSRLIVPIMRRLVLPFLVRRYGVTAIDTGRVLRTVVPPYVVVANHVNYWDPFWISAFLRHPIQFVTSDNIFREAFLGAVMQLVGSIPKTKLMNDPRAVRQIFGVKREGRVIGIFPEGARSDDGRSLPLIPAVARLVRKLGVPVILARIAGGYLSRPRWARTVRRGRVEIEYSLLFSRDDLARLSDDDVHSVMCERLAFDEMAWRRTTRVRFHGRRPAEFLERLLFICPQCRSIAALESRVETLTCTACSYQVRVNRCGFFEPRRGPLFFEDPAQWNSWQLSVFAELLEEREGIRKPFFEERPAVLLKGYRERRLRKVGTGCAALMRDRVVFRADQGRSRSFPLSRILGLNVQNREKLEFYFDNSLFRLDFLKPRASAYRWMKAAQFLAAADQASSLMRVKTY
jgi:1-acyl-sn-glycerol-3-phosphate acyltransferase